MPIGSVATFAGMAFLLALIPGPNALLILNTSISRGYKFAYANIIGVTLVFYFYAVLVGIGLNYLSNYPIIFHILTWFSSIYLAWLGLTFIVQAINVKHSFNLKAKLTTNMTFYNDFLRGILINLLNPKIIFFYLAIVPHFVGQHAVFINALVLGTIQAMIVASWFSLVIFWSGAFKHLLNSVIGEIVLKIFSGSLFLFFSIRLILSCTIH